MDTIVYMCVLSQLISMQLQLLMVGHINIVTQCLIH